MSVSKIKTFSEKILKWFDLHGRHNLPWQKDRSPYRIWVAEIMLQQTQVKTVIPYYQNFLKAFPSVSDLAESSLDEVLSFWAGLGYYSRARNLHESAVAIKQNHNGIFPTHYDDVLALPGIGPSTAGAILAQALNQRHAILDGNVKRVLSRYHAIEGWPGRSVVSALLWEKAEEHTPQKRVDDYTQAIMDLGATICLRSEPKCSFCPVMKQCEAFKSDTVALYPTKKPKKKLPVRQIRMLIIKDRHGAVLLEKRPPTGIWGGLWSLPEINVEDDAERACKEKFALKTKAPRLGDAFRHTFSHYHLDITPCWMSVDGEVDAVREGDEIVWCDSGNLKRIGVSTPVASLLAQAFT